MPPTQLTTPPLAASHLTQIEQVRAEIAACRLCEAHLPHDPRPVVRFSATARLLIVGQAPGAKVHASGTPFDDASGETLRRWLNLTPAQFYDTAQIALVPTGLCYPGRHVGRRGRGGDLPPRLECAPTWHPRIRALLPDIRLTLLVGAYAQAYYLGGHGLGGRRKRTLAETVRQAANYLPAAFPIPHPSPRNRLWLRRNPWFEAETVPILQAAVAACLRSVSALG